MLIIKMVKRFTVESKLSNSIFNINLMLSQLNVLYRQSQFQLLQAWCLVWKTTVKKS